jgi:hypothetical protein
MVRENRRFWPLGMQRDFAAVFVIAPNEICPESDERLQMLREAVVR